MRKIIKYIDKPLLIVTLILFTLGLIMVFSASNVTAYMSHAVSPYNYFFKQGMFLLVGLFLSIIMIKFNTKSYGFFSWGLMLLSIGALILLLIMGSAKNQAVSWFDLGIISIQPSEFIKVITIVFLANYYDGNQKKLKSWTSSLFPIGICVIIAALIFIQPDLGTTIIYTCIVAIIFFSVPIASSIKRKILFIAVGIITIGALTMLSLGKEVILERQLERFDFKRPCDRILDNGNQVCNCYIAINNGGLFGLGLGKSVQKYLYLPEAHTDFIFPVIVEEMGLFGGFIILLLYAFLLFKLLSIARSTKDLTSSIIVYGTFSYLLLHMVVNLGGILALIPLTGVPLPFMSYGGSYMLNLIILLSLSQRVVIENKQRKYRSEFRKIMGG